MSLRIEHSLDNLCAASATPEQSADMRQAFQEGIAWGDCKNKLFLLINLEFAEARELYNTLLEYPDDVAAELDKGAISWLPNTVD